MTDFDIKWWHLKSSDPQRAHAAAKRSDDTVEVGITENADHRLLTVLTPECARRVENVFRAAGRMPSGSRNVLSFVRAVVYSDMRATSLYIAEEEEGSALEIHVSDAVDPVLLDALSTDAASAVKKAIRDAGDSG